MRHRGRTARSAATPVLIFLVVCGAIDTFTQAAQAAPTWLTPQGVFSTPVTKIQDDSFFNRKALDVASDAAGDSIVAWVEEHPKSPGPGTECQAMTAVRPAGGSFGAPQPLGPPMSFCAGQIKVAMNAGGTAVVAWKQGNEIDASMRPARGSFGGAKAVSNAPSTDDPWAAINAAGVAVVSWDDDAVGSCPGPPSWAFHATVRLPGGEFGPVETVCDAPRAFLEPVIFTPRVAVDSEGDVLASWVNEYAETAGTTHVAVEWAFRQAGGSFDGAGPTALRDMVTSRGAQGFAPQIAFDASGRATAIWPYDDGSKVVIETATRPPGVDAIFSPPGPVSGPLESGDASSPWLAVDPATNTAAAVWVQCPSSCEVEGSMRASGSGFQPPEVLSGPGATTSFGPLVAFDPSGAATTTWSGPSPDIGGTQVQATTRPPGVGQSFGSVKTISNADASESPAIAFDGEGNAIVVWAHTTGSPPSAIIQYAGFDAAPPEIQAVSAPNGVVGKGTAFSASVFDRWSATTVGWSFGDGSSATGTSVSHTYTRPGNYTVTVRGVDAVGNETQQSHAVRIAKAKPKKCKKGFRRKKHKHKRRCVRVKHHHHHHKKKEHRRHRGRVN
jgi:hypothetical protein